MPHKKKLYMKCIHVLFVLFSIFFFKVRMEIDSTKISMLEVEVDMWFSKLCMAESIHNNIFSFFFFEMGEGTLVIEPETSLVKKSLHRVFIT